MQPPAERVQPALVEGVELGAGTLPKRPVLIERRVDAALLVRAQHRFNGPLRPNGRGRHAERDVQRGVGDAVVRRPLAVHHPHDGDLLVRQQHQIRAVARVAALVPDGSRAAVRTKEPADADGPVLRAAAEFSRGRPHHVARGRLQDAASIELAAVHVRDCPPRHVRHVRVEVRARRMDSVVGEDPAGKRRALLVELVPPRQERPVGLLQEQRAVCHLQWFEDVPLHVVVERFARRFGHHVAENLEGHVAVAHALARRRDQLLIRQAPHVPLQRAVIVLRLVPLVVVDVGHAGRVRHHLADGDLVRAIVGDAEVRQILHHRRVQVDRVALDELHDRRRHERLGDRRHVKQRSRGQRIPVRSVRL